MKVLFSEVFLFDGSNSVALSEQQLPCMWELVSFDSNLILEPGDLGYERKPREIQVLQVVPHFCNSFLSRIDNTSGFCGLRSNI